MLLSSSFLPLLGGVETLLYQTFTRIAEPPLVIAPTPAHAPDMAITPVGMSTVDRAAYRPLWKIHPTLHFSARFWRPTLRAMRAWRPRVLVAGHIYLAPLTWMLARRTRRPFVVCAYGQEVWRGGAPMGLPNVDEFLRGGALRAADAVLVPGSFTAGLLNDWQVGTEVVRCIPYGAEPRPEPTIRSNAARLLTVARLVPRKGIDMVIGALPELDPSVDYHIVGTGPDEPRLRDIAVQCGVADRVRFLGRVDDARLAREYRECALFVLPARRTADGQLEGYGLVYFEAAAWGRAVVAGRSGGEVDAVVDGHTGVLVAGESAADVTRGIRDLLADPDRRERLGRAGKVRVESTHNWQLAAAAVDRVLEELA
ncbi:MAG: glycosyltransferase family 4 protein [Chloroflexi bacterium]|nr:glycosyltransferase family 4 protein [Chloroflexota bacterium]